MKKMLVRYDPWSLVDQLQGDLDMLAGRLGLDDALVDHIEATVAGLTV